LAAFVAVTKAFLALVATCFGSGLFAVVACGVAAFGAILVAASVIAASSSGASAALPAA
jgi:hypothetical protein